MTRSEEIARIVESEMHYRQCCQPIAKFAAELREAIEEDGCERLALVMRGHDSSDISSEIARIYDTYWHPIVLKLVEDKE